MNRESEKRNKAILESAETLLPNRVHGSGHNFMLSGEEAATVGNAVAFRNHKALRDVLAEPVSQLEEHYDSISIDDFKREWEVKLEKATGLQGNLLDFIDNEAKSAALDKILADGLGIKQLDLLPISYVKFLETIIYATAPEGLTDFDPSFALSQRQRKKNGLHSRCLNVLETICDQELGIRKIREGLLRHEDDALDGYLRNLSRKLVAQKAYANIIELYNAGKADGMRDAARLQLESDDEFDELLHTHILNWEMLPAEITDSPDRNRRIRKIIHDRAKDKQGIDDNWSDENIDVLFETASLAISRGRQADIFISSTFDGGRGLYLATEISHPTNADKKIVIADNPIKGNALYIVDEELSSFDEETGRQYEWREVLGSYRRIARARGARRRYHTGNWAELPKAVCEYGGDAALAKKIKEEHEKDIEGHSRDISQPERTPYEGLLAAIQRAEAFLVDIEIDKKH